ncbi:MAG: RecQ family ATP-dependent DNA helicase [Microcoleaceae cyanobacterium]
MMKQPDSIPWEQVQTAFYNIWGYTEFRPPQAEIIQTLLTRKDALIVMPTGGGKSICFQLPAVLKTGLTLVISPLVALMENQVQELHQHQLLAGLIHSQISKQKRQQTLSKLQQNRLRLLYLSPETLFTPTVWNILSQPDIMINGLILDEAHCLVQWGDTFRPAYRRLGTVRAALLKTKPKNSKIAIAAFTATADPAAQNVIQSVLKLQQPRQYLLNPYRKNLDLNIKTVWTPHGRQQQLFNFIQTHPQQSGLVYVRTRKQSEKLAALLSGKHYKTAAYHGGLSGVTRRKIEQAWLQDKIQFVVCTSAFGLGINKSNVRWVIHFQAPCLLSEYIQEIGRAGRDGLPATALTLRSEPTGWLYPEDKKRRQFLMENLRQQEQIARKLAKKLPYKGELNAVSRQHPEAAMALSLLHSWGQLTWRDPFHYQITTEKSKSYPKHNQNAMQTMTQYLNTGRCRWQFLLQAFGFTDEAESMRCGHCDNCRSLRISL